MKLSEYAKKIGVSYRTAWNYFRAGKLNAYQTHTGTVIVREEDKPTEGKVAVYCRVSFSENKTNLESQKKRLLDYAAARGYQVSKVITEVGSGINDTRKQWLSLLQDRSISSR
jgi:predicted site-specific integrase-resolvase